MDKKGQKVMFGLMVSIILFIAGTQLFPVITDSIAETRNESNLNCSSTTLSTGASANCVLIDWAGFYWFGTVLVVVAAVLTLRKLNK